MTQDILELIFTDPDIGLIPYLEHTLGNNWNRHYIKPWFPKSSVPRECGWRAREASSVIESDGRRVVTQMIALGRIFFMEDHTEAVLQAMRLQNDMDEAVVNWRDHVNPHLIGPIDGFEGGSLEPIQNQAISGDRPYAWIVPVIRYFALSFEGFTTIEFCEDP